MEIKTLKKDSTKGFSLLAGVNREIIPSHVTKLCTSIEENDVIRPVLVADISFITGSPVSYIIDGQHLYHALLRMGKDIPYMILPNKIKDHADLANRLALLNNSSKSWSMKDYITVWSGVNKDYVSLNKYFNIYDIELSQLAEILMTGSCMANIGGSTVISKNIKKGEFKIENETHSIALLNYITDALKIVPRMDRLSNKLFIASYVTHMNTASSYKHAQFLVNLKANKDKFKTLTHDPEEYRRLLKSIS